MYTLFILFVGYLIALSVTLDYMASSNWMIVNSDLNRLRKEAVVDSFRVMFQYLLGLMKIMENLSRSGCSA
jgi:hypothetical protein